MEVMQAKLAKYKRSIKKYQKEQEGPLEVA